MIDIRKAALAALILAAPATASAATVQLSKVLLDTESKPVAGRLKGGTLCVFPSDINVPKVKKTEEYERNDVLFTDRLKLAGYRVVTTSQDLFASANAANSADYLIGATIRPETMNLCSSVNGWKGEMIIEVEWQVYDRVAQKVVETLTTTGRGDLLKFNADGYNQIWNAAFRENLGHLVEQAAIRQHLGEPDAKIMADAQAAAAEKAAAEAAAIAAAEAAKQAKRKR